MKNNQRCAEPESLSHYPYLKHSAAGDTNSLLSFVCLACSQIHHRLPDPHAGELASLFAHLFLKASIQCREETAQQVRIINHFQLILSSAVFEA